MTRGRRFLLVAVVMAWAVIGPTAWGHNGIADGQHGAVDEVVLDETQALRQSQAAIGNPIGAISFTDSAGRTVRLSDFLGRPLVISFIYSGCAQSCSVITNVLADALDNARDVLGRDSFTTITIGFDVANDTPGRMRNFARQRGVEGVPGWYFLSGTASAIKALAKATGFQFFPSAKGFNHIDQVTVVDAEGRVNAQIYGEKFNLPLLVEPLKELVLGTPQPFRSVADLIKKVRLFCTLYDPKSGRYYFDYSLFIQISAGVVVIGAGLIFLVREIRAGRRRRNRELSA